MLPDIGIFTILILMMFYWEFLILQTGQLPSALMGGLSTGTRKEPKAGQSSQRKRLSDCYNELFGACYVHGMMNGEAIQFQNDKHVKAEIYELR